MPVFPFPFGSGQPSHSNNMGGTPLPRRKQKKPVTGFRTWRIKYDGESVALWSLMQSHVWETSGVAECLPYRHHEAPDPECACGFYTQLPEHPLTEWETHVRGRVRATGTVLLSGRIIVCKYGYKAQYAVIESPVVVDAGCKEKGCIRPVAHIQAPGASTDFWCHCDTHLPEREDTVLLDVGPWMEQTLEDLHGRYPDVDFLTWMEL